MPLPVPLPDTAVQHKPAHRLHHSSFLPKSFSDRASSSLSILCSGISLRIVSSCLILSSVSAAWQRRTIHDNRMLTERCILLFALQCPGSASAPVLILALRFFLFRCNGQVTSSTTSSRHAIKILTHIVRLLARIARGRDSVKAANRMERIQLHQCPHRVMVASDPMHKQTHQFCLHKRRSAPSLFLTEISVFDGQFQRKLLCQLLHPCNPFSGYKDFIPWDIKGPFVQLSL